MTRIGNYAPLRGALEYIIENPQDYDQATWRRVVIGGCRTTRCVAGWITTLAGWTEHPVSLEVWPGYLVQEAAEAQGAIRSYEDAALAIIGARTDAQELHDGWCSSLRTSYLLFDGGLTWRGLLSNVMALAVVDQATDQLGPIVMAEMEHMAVTPHDWEPVAKLLVGGPF